MLRLTCAPSLVWCCTFHRKISPTAICSRSKPPASIFACVPLPLPWMPMMTYFRMQLLSHGTGLLAPGHAEYTSVPLSQVIPVDTELPWEVLGGLPEMVQTAYGSLTIGLDLPSILVWTITAFT